MPGCSTSTTRVGTTSGEVGYGEVTLRDVLATPRACRASRAVRGGSAPAAATSTALAAANDGGGRVAGPGEWFHYSNLGYGLLGEVVARRLGAPWRGLVAERLLPARHAGDVVPPASGGAAGLERGPLHRGPGPRAADRHRCDGPGRPALVHPRRPRDVGSGARRRATRRGRAGTLAEMRRRRGPATASG